MSDMRELYQQLIMDHNRNPRNFGRMDDATSHANGHNPLCGDRVTIYLNVQDGIIKDVRFEGVGCAISKSSASIMTTVLKGKRIEEADGIFDGFHKLVTGVAGVELDEETAERLATFNGIKKFPARVKCASLAWHTMEAALHASDSPVSTE